MYYFNLIYARERQGGGVALSFVICEKTFYGQHSAYKYSVHPELIPKA